jgi:methylated-DNA-[protein]-cysteine S-methyltransferase
MPAAYRETAIGGVSISEKDGKITGLYFENSAPPSEGEPQETPLIGEAFRQLEEYLNGTRQSFDLPLAAEGTAWQQKCWDALTKIPYGKTATYGEIARMAGNPKASRAVGRANNRNPISIFIPCHRVIGADGSLTGYGGGLPLKEKLLRLEGCQLPDAR